jgi:outer membrane protein OmpA-like peptidoglycan-associated protein
MDQKSFKIRFIVGLILILSVGTGCASPGKGTAEGAGIGAVGGAGIGALLGGGKGALIGAGVGAAAGGVVGNRMDAQAQELAKVAETKRTADGILVNLKDDLLFDSGSANLKDAASGQLTQLSGILAKYPNDHILIVGHTDNSGTATNNETLSENRANSVKDILLQNGVKSNQITTEGFGESKPIASNTKRAGQAKNRRVEVFITDTGKK